MLLRKHRYETREIYDYGLEMHIQLFCNVTAYKTTYNAPDLLSTNVIHSRVKKI